MAAQVVPGLPVLRATTISEMDWLTHVDGP